MTEMLVMFWNLELQCSMYNLGTVFRLIVIHIKDAGYSIQFFLIARIGYIWIFT